MFENGALREIFGLKRDEVTGEWRRLHFEELHAASSPNIIPVIQSRRMRRAEHVVCMGDRKVSYKDLVRISEGTNHL